MARKSPQGGDPKDSDLRGGVEGSPISAEAVQELAALGAAEGDGADGAFLGLEGEVDLCVLPTGG